jgi:hypothetical protein
MEHLLHLTAKHFVESIAPGLSKQHSTCSTDTNSVLAKDNGSNNDDDNNDIKVVDLLGKAIALVKQVCISVEIELHLYNSPYRFASLLRPEHFSA